jgi:predicted O-methyltransferase YrrM
MDDTIHSFPHTYSSIFKQTQDYGFDQLSDGKAGAFLAALCASKPKGRFLELGTGTGLCTSWMLEGMCSLSTLLTVDNDQNLVNIAKNHLSNDSRVEFLVGDGKEIIQTLQPETFDLIFADTWPGKYNSLDETLALLKAGGIYIIDDMLPQRNWPEGHDKKAEALLLDLQSRSDLLTTKMAWSTGIVVCVKQ